MRILVYTSGTGGGHDMRARSLKQWAEANGDEVDIIQLLENTGSSYAAGVHVYNWIQRKAPILHHIYFNALELIRPCAHTGLMPHRAGFDALMRARQPDIVVSVHGTLNHGFLTWSRETFGPHVPFVTYCGELHGGYGFSRNWVNPKADLFVGAVEETAAAARSLGMSPERVVAGGFLLHPRFWDAPMTSDEREAWTRETLGLDPSAPILALSTGAVGANNHLAFLNALKREKVETQVAVLCGNNRPIFEAVAAWSRDSGSVTARPIGYTDEMHHLMQCVTCIVTRPGTGTTSEAITVQCPVIFNGLGGVMPQERITLLFARKHGFGELIRSPGGLPAAARKLLFDPDQLAQNRAAMSEAAPARHPIDILSHLRACIARIGN